MKKVIAIASVFAASCGVLTADVAAATRAGGEHSLSRWRTERPGEHVVEGTIAWADRQGTKLVLENGTVLTVPPSVDVVHTKLLPRRPVKAYYVTQEGRNVVTAIELRGVHPGEVG